MNTDTLNPIFDYQRGYDDGYQAGFSYAEEKARQDYIDSKKEEGEGKMEHLNAVLDVDTEEYLCPECKQLLGYFCEPPAEYLYCDNSQCGLYMADIFDPETGENIGMLGDDTFEPTEMEEDR